MHRHAAPAGQHPAARRTLSSAFFSASSRSFCSFFSRCLLDGRGGGVPVDDGCRAAVHIPDAAKNRQHPGKSAAAAAPGAAPGPASARRGPPFPASWWLRACLHGRGKGRSRSQAWRRERGRRRRRHAAAPPVFLAASRQSPDITDKGGGPNGTVDAPTTAKPTLVSGLRRRLIKELFGLRHSRHRARLQGQGGSRS